MAFYGTFQSDGAKRLASRKGLVTACSVALGLFVVLLASNESAAGRLARPFAFSSTATSEDCGHGDLAFYTMISNGQASFKQAGVHGEFTYFNFSLGPSNLAPVVAVRVEDDARDLYSTIKTAKFFKEWRYGYVEEGMDFNPDALVVPEDKLVKEGNMSAAITIRFAEDDGSTTLFPGQFVALDKIEDDLYTMVVRVYTDDDKTAAQLQSSRGEDHTCYDSVAPHFHTFPHPDLGAVLGSSATELVVSEAFVVEVYFVLDPALPWTLFA